VLKDPNTAYSCSMADGDVVHVVTVSAPAGQAAAALAPAASPQPPAPQISQSAGPFAALPAGMPDAFIDAVRSANVDKMKAMLTSVDGPSRAKLCQDCAIDADGRHVPALVLAAQLNFKLVARYLLYNGAIPDIIALYSDDQSQFETNVRNAGWISAEAKFNLAPLILECILFQHGDSLSDESCKIVVKKVGLGTMSVTRDSLLIAAVKKSAVFAQRILDLDPSDHIYGMITRGDLSANEKELDALNLMHRSPGSEWKNALEWSNDLSYGYLEQRILEKVARQERMRIQLLFYLCTLLSADALKWFKYLILPERRDISKSPGLPKNQSAEALRAWDLFSCKYDGQFDGHALSQTFKKGDTFLHVAARFETDASGAFLLWLLQHASFALEMKNCEGMEPAQCAKSDAVRAVIESRQSDFHFRPPMSAEDLVTQYDVFISYRNNTEANFATALHYILSAPPFSLKVYLDKYSMPVGGGHLSAGKPLDHGDKYWMVGLYKAMYNSKIILILVSHEGIVAPFAHPTARTDACLAEHFFASMLDCMRSMFHPSNGMHDCSNIRTVLVGPFPDPFVPLLDVREYIELQKLIPDHPHSATTDKCLEVVHFCASPRSFAPAVAELDSHRPTEKISNLKFRSTRTIFHKITGSNNIRPDIESKQENAYFGKLENIAHHVAKEVLLIPAHYTEPAIEEYVPFVRIKLEGRFELLNEDDVKRAFGNICDAAGVVETLNARLKSFFAGSIGLDVEICSAVESPLTCSETIKRFLRAYRCGRLDMYNVLSVEVADPLQLWPRIIAYERALYGAMDHPEIQFSVRELETASMRGAPDGSLLEEVGENGVDSALFQLQSRFAGATSLFQREKAEEKQAEKPQPLWRDSTQWPATNVVLLKSIKRQAPCASPSSSGFFMRYSDIKEAETFDAGKFYEKGIVDQRRISANGDGRCQLRGRNSDTGRVFEFQTSDNFCLEDYFDKLKSKLEEYRNIWPSDGHYHLTQSKANDVWYVGDLRIFIPICAFVGREEHEATRRDPLPERSLEPIPPEFVELMWFRREEKEKKTNRTHWKSLEESALEYRKVDKTSGFEYTDITNFSSVSYPENQERLMALAATWQMLNIGLENGDGHERASPSFLRQVLNQMSAQLFSSAQRDAAQRREIFMNCCTAGLKDRCHQIIIEKLNALHPDQALCEDVAKRYVASSSEDVFDFQLFAFFTIDKSIIHIFLAWLCRKLIFYHQRDVDVEDARLISKLFSLFFKASKLADQHHLQEDCARLCDEFFSRQDVEIRVQHCAQKLSSLLEDLKVSRDAFSKNTLKCFELEKSIRKVEEAIENVMFQGHFLSHDEKELRQKQADAVFLKAKAVYQKSSSSENPHGGGGWEEEEEEEDEEEEEEEGEEKEGEVCQNPEKIIKLLQERGTWKSDCRDMLQQLESLKSHTPAFEEGNATFPENICGDCEREYPDKCCCILKRRIKEQLGNIKEMKTDILSFDESRIDQMHQTTSREICDMKGCVRLYQAQDTDLVSSRESKLYIVKADESIELLQKMIRAIQEMKVSRALENLDTDVWDNFSELAEPLCALVQLPSEHRSDFPENSPDQQLPSSSEAKHLRQQFEWFQFVRGKHLGRENANKQNKFLIVLNSLVKQGAADVLFPSRFTQNTHEDRLEAYQESLRIYNGAILDADSEQLLKVKMNDQFKEFVRKMPAQQFVDRRMLLATSVTPQRAGVAAFIGKDESESLDDDYREKLRGIPRKLANEWCIPLNEGHKHTDYFAPELFAQPPDVTDEYLNLKLDCLIKDFNEEHSSYLPLGIHLPGGSASTLRDKWEALEYAYMLFPFQAGVYTKQDALCLRNRNWTSTPRSCEKGSDLRCFWWQRRGYSGMEPFPHEFATNAEDHPQFWIFDVSIPRRFGQYVFKTEDKDMYREPPSGRRLFATAPYTAYCWFAAPSIFEAFDGVAPPNCVFRVVLKKSRTRKERGLEDDSFDIDLRPLSTMFKCDQFKNIISNEFLQFPLDLAGSRHSRSVTAFAVDHIFPLSYGGLTVPQNLQALHWKANLVKKTDDTSLLGYGLKPSKLVDMYVYLHLLARGSLTYSKPSLSSGYGKLSSDQSFDEQIWLNSGDPMREKLSKAPADHILRSQWALQKLENVLCYKVSDLSIFRPGGFLDLEMLTADHEALQSLGISTQPREANHEAKTMLAVARGRSYYRNILYKVYPDLAREGAPSYYKHVITRWLQQTTEHQTNSKPQNMRKVHEQSTLSSV
jgi:hypothetical protein